MCHRGVRGPGQLAWFAPAGAIRGGRHQLERPHHLHRHGGLAGDRDGGCLRLWDLLEPRQQGLGRRDSCRGQSGGPLYRGILGEQGQHPPSSLRIVTTTIQPWVSSVSYDTAACQSVVVVTEESPGQWAAQAILTQLHGKSSSTSLHYKSALNAHCRVPLTDEKKTEEKFQRG